MTREQLEQAFMAYATDDLEAAVILITGLFVGVNVAYCDLRGDEGDGLKNIHIKGPEGQRAITIHAADKDAVDG